METFTKKAQPLVSPVTLAPEPAIAAPAPSRLADYAYRIAALAAGVVLFSTVL